MKQLRKLAKGHEYRVSEPNGALLVLPTKGTFYWEYSKAPASCFTDAEEPLREGDRVVVVNESPHWNGKSGIVSEVGIPMPVSDYKVYEVIMDVDGEGHLFKPSRLRRERPDERPAEKKPEPPRKYEDGQWVEFTYTGSKYLIRNGMLIGSCWHYGLQIEGTPADSACYPQGQFPACPPPLSDAQRRLQPGDKVTVRKQRWDAEGKPMVDWEGEASWTIFTTFLSSGRVRARLENGRGAYKSEWLHNLDPV